jgi:hypothetical protein
LDTAITVEQLRGDYAGFGVLFQEIDECEESTGLYFSIWVKEQDVLAFGYSYGLVIGFGKAKVLGIGGELYPRIFFGHHWR